MSKLFNKIASGFSGGSSILSVSVGISPDQLSIHGGIFKLNNGELELDIPYDSLREEELNNRPFVLTCEGRGVLHKFVDSTPEKIKLRSVIPNLKERDFYINYTPCGNGTWVSLIRKDTVEKLLNDLSLSLELMVDLHLGALAIQWFSESYPSSLPRFIGNTEIEYVDGAVKELRKCAMRTKFPQSIFGFDLAYTFHLSFVGALVYKSGLNALHRGEQWLLNERNIKDKKGYQLSVKLVLGLLLLVFMGNMITGQLLNTQLNEKSNLAQAHISLVNESEFLQEEEKLKKEFIQQLGLEVNPHFAHFVDEIGETVPDQIQLNGLTINPLSKSIRKKKQIEFKNEIIHVGGFCKSSQICNNWIDRLRSLNWAKKVELVEFKINKKNIGEFLIEVSY